MSALLIRRPVKRPVFRLILLPLVTAALGSCASHHPASERTYQEEVPAEWDAQNDPSAIEDEWWQRFGDERLNALIHQAQLENPSLRQSEAITDQARAQARIAGADRLPQLSGAFSGSKQKQSLAGFPIPQGEGQPTSATSENYGLSLEVSWELDLWGRIASQEEAAIEDFLASEQNYRAVQQSIAAQTAKAYFRVIEAREQHDLSLRTVAVLEETARQVGNRSEHGIVSPTDKLLAETNLETARAGLQQSQDTLQKAIRQLEILLRDYPDGEISTPERLPDVPTTPPAGAPAGLLSRRPDLIAAERAMRASGLRLAASRRALLPSISLTGSTGTQSSELTNLLNGDFSVWSIAGQAVQPLFQGGRLRANIALSEANEREAAEAYVEAVLTAFSEVEAALAADALLAAREASLLKAADAAAEAQRIALNRYEQGVTPFLTVLESQQRTLDTRSGYLAARRARLDNRIDLHLALGGGFASPTTAIAEGSTEYPDG
ncbi:efflux transporter outer membrane subunit [Henriciella aquimarina]|uniref:efflux transporter outer membrane subunit n=1 Tax=Henriciella aquimarina TaxID=545261 RepID=UPI0009FC32EE|nr:TolC family protein [Henriciella aquimarina]